MLDQSISRNSLKYVLSDHDMHLFQMDAFGFSEEDVINSCIETFRLDSDFEIISHSEINGKKIFRIEDITYHILLKRLNETLKTINRVKQSDRESIVRGIKSLLLDMNGYSIHRLDISGFYENVSLDTLKKVIFEDEIYSNSTKVLVAKWFKCFEQSGSLGLPRGLSISSTLSEIYMKAFDNNVRLLPNTLYYARFVDDIFYVSTDSSKDSYMKLNNLLPEGIKFSSHPNKRYIVDCLPGDSKRKVDFSYLGYRFNVNNKDKKDVNVNVGLSNDKIKKIKGRISRALISFYKDEDFDLLEQRFRFLTCNYILSSRYRGTKIRSGIFYNYRSITNLGKEDLKRLDDFKNNLIFIDKFRFKLVNDKIDLTLDQKKNLAKRSFYLGHKNRVFYKFSIPKILKIKECWR